MTRIYDALQIQSGSGQGSSAESQLYGEPSVLPREELVALYHGIRNQLPPESRPIVEITSSVRGEGTSTLARDLATTMAGALGLRVLLVTVQTAETAERGLEAVATGEAKIADIVAPAKDGPFYRAGIKVTGTSARFLFDSGELDRVLGDALELVDYILVDAPPILTDVASMVLTRCAGGVILVIEAERTRAPIVDQARRAIEGNGGRLIGVVMNKRRYHIPPAIYRRL